MSTRQTLRSLKLRVDARSSTAIIPDYSSEARILSDKILIRAVREDDFAEWKPLWDGYNAFYGRKEKTALPDAITNMTWSRFFDGYEPTHALVAEQSGQLLGLAHFLFHRSTISIEPMIATISAIIVLLSSMSTIALMFEKEGARHFRRKGLSLPSLMR